MSQINDVEYQRRAYGQAKAEYVRLKEKLGITKKGGGPEEQKDMEDMMDMIDKMGEQGVIGVQQENIDSVNPWTSLEITLIVNGQKQSNDYIAAKLNYHVDPRNNPRDEYLNVVIHKPSNKITHVLHIEEITVNQASNYFAFRKCLCAKVINSISKAFQLDTVVGDLDIIYGIGIDGKKYAGYTQSWIHFTNSSSNISLDDSIKFNVTSPLNPIFISKINEPVTPGAIYVKINEIVNPTTNSLTLTDLQYYGSKAPKILPSLISNISTSGYIKFILTAYIFNLWNTNSNKIIFRSDKKIPSSTEINIIPCWIDIVDKTLTGMEKIGYDASFLGLQNVSGAHLKSSSYLQALRGLDIDFTVRNALNIFPHNSNVGEWNKFYNTYFNQNFYPQYNPTLRDILIVNPQVSSANVKSLNIACIGEQVDIVAQFISKFIRLQSYLNVNAHANSSLTNLYSTLTDNYMKNNYTGVYKDYISKHDHDYDDQDRIYPKYSHCKH